MKKIIIIAVAVVLIIAVAVVAFIVLSSGSDEPKPIEYLEFSLDEAYSNLADGASSKIVKYAVIIQYVEDETTTVLTKNKVKIEDAIDEIMRSTSSEELEKSNGKERLRNKIKERIISELELDDTIITDIFIKPFVIQG